MIKVVLDEVDADRLLTVLYNGRKPERVHTLVCFCGAIADLRRCAGAWNGWQILPHAKCPSCVRVSPESQTVERYPHLARKRFMRLVEQLSLREEV